MPVDVVAFGPHPDDVELAMGGTLLKLHAAGYRTGIVDLTAGEKGTRGTPEQRAREAEEGAKLLGASVRFNLDLGDGRLESSPVAKRKVAEAIRELKPRLVFTNYPEHNHPDHEAAGRLVADAAYLAGLSKLEASGEPHRPNRVLYYLVPHKVAPSFIVDVTAFHERRWPRCAPTPLNCSRPEARIRRPLSASRDFSLGSKPSSGTTAPSSTPISEKRSTSGKRCASTTR